MTKCCLVCDTYKVLRSVPDWWVLAVVSGSSPLWLTEDDAGDAGPLGEMATSALISQEAGTPEGFLEERDILIQLRSLITDTIGLIL